jgi:hypothetical protein
MTNVVGMGIYVKHLKCFLKLAKPFSIVKRKSAMARKVRGARTCKPHSGGHRESQAADTDNFFVFSCLLFEIDRQSKALGDHS